MHGVTLEDKGALEAIYTRYGSSVYSLAMYMLKQGALAEEATQDIFLNVWLKASSYRTDRGEPQDRGRDPVKAADLGGDRSGRL